jgi:hypothetical protein
VYKNFQEKMDEFKGGSSDVVIAALKDRALIALQGTTVSVIKILVVKCNESTTQK